MKKLLLAAILVFLGGKFVFSGDDFSAPTGKNANPINADYGGVDVFITTVGAAQNAVKISTLGLPSAASQSPLGTYGNVASTTTASNDRWRIYGAVFSTGNCGANDFIEVFNSTGGFVDAKRSSTYLRFYNVSGSSGSTTGSAGDANSSCQGVTALDWPIRMNGNVFMRVSNPGYLSQGLLYYKEPE